MRVLTGNGRAKSRVGVWSRPSVAGGWGSTGTERGQRPVLPGQDRRPACSQDEKASRSLKTGAAIKTAANPSSSRRLQVARQLGEVGRDPPRLALLSLLI